jgi:hypothetical protein
MMIGSSEEVDVEARKALARGALARFVRVREETFRADLRFIFKDLSRIN